MAVSLMTLDKEILSSLIENGPIEYLAASPRVLCKHLGLAIHQQDKMFAALGRLVDQELATRTERRRGSIRFVGYAAVGHEVRVRKPSIRPKPPRVSRRDR